MSNDAPAQVHTSSPNDHPKLESERQSRHKASERGDSESSVSLLKASKVSRISCADSELQPRPDSSERPGSAILNPTSWDYCWNVQHHSISDYPADWTHSVQLLTTYMKSESYNLSLKKAVKESHEVTDSIAKSAMKSTPQMEAVHTALPRTLSLKCPALYLHKLKLDPVDAAGASGDGIFSGKVKAICTKGTIYRLFRKDRKGIEIYPEDGSIICSSELTGQTFSHFIFNGIQVEEKVYSRMYPPPVSPDFPYSISRLVSTAVELLEMLSSEDLVFVAKDDDICYEYKEVSETFKVPSLPSIVEECVVPGLGRFSVQSNGAVRIVFVDRTCLDMQTQLDSQPTEGAKEKSSIGRSSGLCSGWPPGTCRLLLPNGQYYFADLNKPDAPYASYVHAALDWVSWVNTPASERQAFQRDAESDSYQWRNVDLELKKIQCFSYILENSFLPQIKSVMKKPDISSNKVTQRPLKIESNPSTQDSGIEFDMAAVNEILRKNSEKIKELDEFLKLNGEIKPSRENKTTPSSAE